MNTLPEILVKKHRRARDFAHYDYINEAHAEVTVTHTKGFTIWAIENKWEYMEFSKMCWNHAEKQECTLDELVNNYFESLNKYL